MCFLPIESAHQSNILLVSGSVTTWDPQTDPDLQAPAEFIINLWWTKEAIITTCNLAGSVDRGKIVPQMNELHAQLRDYEPAHTFNMDETALFYILMPRCTYITNTEGRKTTRGTKNMRNKDRLTVILCANADGSIKVPIAVIGAAVFGWCHVQYTTCIKGRHEVTRGHSENGFGKCLYLVWQLGFPPQQELLWLWPISVHMMMTQFSIQGARWMSWLCHQIAPLFINRWMLEWFELSKLIIAQTCCQVLEVLPHKLDWDGQRRELPKDWKAFLKVMMLMCLMLLTSCRVHETASPHNPLHVAGWKRTFFQGLWQRKCRIYLQKHVATVSRDMK